jgi:hypothetical protein
VNHRGLATIVGAAISEVLRQAAPGLDVDEHGAKIIMMVMDMAEPRS